MPASDYIDDAMGLALMYAMQKGVGGSGGTPNFYPIPLTPEQKRVEDEKWRLYKAGGSPQTQFVQEAGKQFLSQMPTGPKNHSFISPLMQGQTFAGGVTLPKFDFSKMPGFNTPPQTGPQAPDPNKQPSPLASPGGGHPDGSQDQNWGIYGTPNPNTLADLDKMATTPGPSGMSFMDAWSKFQQEHPNWAKLGVNAVVGALTAMTGLAGAAIGKLIQYVFLKDRPEIIEKNRDITDLGFPAADWTPGKNTREHVGGGFADGAAGYHNAVWGNNLANPGESAAYGSGGTKAGQHTGYSEDGVKNAGTRIPFAGTRGNRWQLY